jgi:hypothetical protein
MSSGWMVATTPSVWQTFEYLACTLARKTVVWPPFVGRWGDRQPCSPLLQESSVTGSRSQARLAKSGLMGLLPNTNKHVGSFAALSKNTRNSASENRLLVLVTDTNTTTIFCLAI